MGEQTQRSKKRDTDIENPAPDHDQPVIDAVGEEGTVSTPDGETSVGTTPIGVGSLEPVGHHREAADRIMGQASDDPEALDRDSTEQPRRSPSGSTRP